MLCPKCGGQGFIREYGHVANGVCFTCNGRGHVASNGKAARSIKQSQVIARFPGFSKRDMKAIIDDALSGVDSVSFSAQYVYSAECAHYARYAQCGLYSAEIKGNSMVFRPNFHRGSFNSLIDWSK